jgi:hypothetical protein
MGRHQVAVVNLHITYAQTMKVDYSRFSLGGLHGKHVVATWKGKAGTIPEFALGPRKTKKNLCQDGHQIKGLCKRRGNLFSAGSSIAPRSCILVKNMFWSVCCWSSVLGM